MADRTEWERTVIGKVAELATGTTPPSERTEYFGGEIDWYTPVDLRNQGFLSASSRRLTKLAIEDRKARIFLPNTVLLTTIGASLGNLGLLSEAASANQQITGISIFTNEISPEFLFYYLMSRREELVQWSSKATLPILNQKKLKEFPVEYPRLSEQQRIVTLLKECLNRINEIRVLRDETLKEVKALFPAALNSLERENNWSQIRLGNLLLKTQNGRSIAQTKTEGNCRVLTLAAVHDVKLNFERYKVVTAESSVAEKYSIQKNDIFISRSNTYDLVGLSAIALSEAPEKTIFPDLLIRLTPDEKTVVPLFLAYALRFPSVRTQIQNMAKGSSQSMVKISGERLREVLVPLPSIKEQLEALATLKKYQRISTQIREGFESQEIKLLPSTILRRAFAGNL